jgi:hypothetical protein
MALLLDVRPSLAHVLPRRWLRAARKLDPVDTTTLVDAMLDDGFPLGHYISSR